VASSDAALVVAADSLDADPWPLNVENGTLDLEAEFHSPPGLTASSIHTTASGRRASSCRLIVHIADPHYCTRTEP
jgi:phage/plasmid-associated DNA primase